MAKGKKEIKELKEMNKTGFKQGDELEAVVEKKGG